MPLDLADGFFRSRDEAGNLLFDASFPHYRAAQLVQGSVTLPRVELANLPNFLPAPVIDVDVDLGPVDAGVAFVGGGTWRIANAESLALGELRYLRNEQIGTRYYRIRYLYAPRLQQSEWFPLGSVNMLDQYMFRYSVNPFTIETSGTNIPEVGLLWHTLQFVIDNGRLKLIRRGRSVAHEYAYLVLGGFPTQDVFTYAFDCAAITVDFRCWLGAFT